MNTKAIVTDTTDDELVKIQLTKEQISSRAIENNERTQRIEKLEAKKKMITNQLKGEIDEIKSKQGREAEIVGNGYYHDYMPCFKEIDFDLQTVKIIRYDNGEIIRERELKKEEAQLKFKFENETPQEKAIPFQELAACDDDAEQIQTAEKEA